MTSFPRLCCSASSPCLSVTVLHFPAPLSYMPSFPRLCCSASSPCLSVTVLHFPAPRLTWLHFPASVAVLPLHAFLLQCFISLPPVLHDFIPPPLLQSFLSMPFCYSASFPCPPSYMTSSPRLCCRALFRWITVKDLNRIDVDQRVDSDTPMGLLRGIKLGTESYHTLFKRLCRCVTTKTGDSSWYCSSLLSEFDDDSNQSHIITFFGAFM